MLNFLQKSCVLHVGCLCTSKTKCCDELMPTVVHTNYQPTFSRHPFHHSSSCCWEKWTRLCETKKTRTFDKYLHQNNEWLKHFAKFFVASGLTLFELVRNQLNKRIWTSLWICWFRQPKWQVILQIICT